LSATDEKLDQLLSKVGELAVALNRVQEELHSVSASLKAVTAGQTALARSAVDSLPLASKSATLDAAKSASAATTPPPIFETSKQRTLDDIRMNFPEDLESRLSFEEKGEYIIIRPTSFLGTNFAKIASAVRGMGGEYISQGKDSHFRVPKKKN